MNAERPLAAKRVQIPSPECDAMSNAVRRAMRLTTELNKLSFDDGPKVRALFSELTGQEVDERGRKFGGRSGRSRHERRSSK
jgi:hypothetical protein